MGKEKKSKFEKDSAAGGRKEGSRGERGAEGSRREEKGEGRREGACHNCEAKLRR